MVEIIIKENGYAVDGNGVQIAYKLDKEDVEDIRFHPEKKKKLELIPKQGTERYFVKAKGGYVGSIPFKSGKYIANIDPKIGNVNFFKLFEWTNNAMPDTGTDEVVAEKGQTMFELIARIFVKRTNGLIKSGLYRNYITITEEITTIRGRMLIAQKMRSPHRFSVKHLCEFDEFSYDVLENQCLLYCTTLLLRHVNNTNTKQALVMIRNTFLSYGVTLKKVTYRDADSIIFHRLNKKYADTFVFCKLIIQNFAYEKFAGEGFHIPDFTFQMWRIFESFVHQVLKEFYKGQSGYSHIAGKSLPKHVIEHVPNYPDLRRYPKDIPDLYPDNVITFRSTNLIIDTKWEEDLDRTAWFQAISYTLAKQCDTILLLPKIEGGSNIRDGFQIPAHYSAKHLTIHIRTVDFDHAEQSGDYINNLREQIETIAESIPLK